MEERESRRHGGSVGAGPGLGAGGSAGRRRGPGGGGEAAKAPGGGGPPAQGPEGDGAAGPPRAHPQPPGHGADPAPQPGVPRGLARLPPGPGLPGPARRDPQGPPQPLRALRGAQPEAGRPPGGGAGRREGAHRSPGPPGQGGHLQGAAAGRPRGGAFACGSPGRPGPGGQPRTREPAGGESRPGAGGAPRRFWTWRRRAAGGRRGAGALPEHPGDGGAGRRRPGVAAPRGAEGPGVLRRGRQPPVQGPRSAPRGLGGPPSRSLPPPQLPSREEPTDGATSRPGRSALLCIRVLDTSNKMPLPGPHALPLDGEREPDSLGAALGGV